MFWDLEETVIESFTEPHHVNIERMLTISKHFSTSSVEIFSFAIWNSRDKAIFDVKMKVSLEALYDIEITGALMMADVNRSYFKHTGVWLDDIDFTAILGKHGAFVEYVKMVTKGNEEFILVDDVVDNATFHFRDTNTIIHLVNVTNFETVGLP